MANVIAQADNYLEESFTNVVYVQMGDLTFSL